MRFQEKASRLILVCGGYHAPGRGSRQIVAVPRPPPYRSSRYEITYDSPGSEDCDHVSRVIAKVRNSHQNHPCVDASLCVDASPMIAYCLDADSTALQNLYLLATRQCRRETSGQEVKQVEQYCCHGWAQDTCADRFRDRKQEKVGGGARSCNALPRLSVGGRASGHGKSACCMVSEHAFVCPVAQTPASSAQHRCNTVAYETKGLHTVMRRRSFQSCLLDPSCPLKW